MGRIGYVVDPEQYSSNFLEIADYYLYISTYFREVRAIPVDLVCVTPETQFDDALALKDTYEALFVVTGHGLSFGGELYTGKGVRVSALWKYLDIIMVPPGSRRGVVCVFCAGRGNALDEGKRILRTKVFGAGRMDINFVGHSRFPGGVRISPHPLGGAEIVNAMNEMYGFSEFSAYIDKLDSGEITVGPPDSNWFIHDELQQFSKGRRR